MGLSLLSTVGMVDRHKVRYTAAATIADATGRIKSLYFSAEVHYAALCIGNEELAKSEITDENKEMVLQMMLNDVKLLLAECVKVKHVWFAMASTLVCSTGLDEPTKLMMMRRLDAAIAELATGYANVRHAPFAHSFVRNRGFDMSLFDRPSSLSRAGTLMLAESLEKYCDVQLRSNAYNPDRHEAVLPYVGVRTAKRPGIVTTNFSSN